MKFFKNYRRLAAGLTAVLATLLAIVIGCTMLCFQWSTLVDQVLKVDTSTTYVGGDEDADSIYYKSGFGDLNALYKSASDRTSEEQAALTKAQENLLAAEKEFGTREAEEGNVLLKNDAIDEDGTKALPLSSGMKVSMFGYAAGNPVYRSTSGGSKPYASGRQISFVDALATDGITVNPTLQSALEGAASTRVVASSNNQSDIGELNVSFYNDYAGSYASDYNDAAIVVFSRTGGEGNDLNTTDKDGISQLALHSNEADLLKMIKESGKFSRTIVLINSGYAMELGWLDEEQYGVDACLWIGEPGTYGFQGVANVLAGKANPSGRLVDTYAANSLSSPAVQNFGDISFSNNSSYKYIVEAEGIYTGYKYYETRYEDSILNASSSNASNLTTDKRDACASSATSWNYPDEVVFPFGYGLSYTTFTQEIKEVTYDEAADRYTVTVTVTNTGDVAGKCAVAVYAQVPYDKDVAETESVRLVGFNKTLGTLSDGETKESADYDVTDLEAGTLKAGESEDVEVTVDRYLLSVYDEDARSGKGGYVLPAGDYYFAVGSDIHNALNNIIAAKDSTAANRLVEANGTAYAAVDDAGGEEPAQAYKLNNIGSELDESTYAASPYTGEDVSNELAAQDVNYWQKGTVTYLSRENWTGTFPSKIENLQLSDAMKTEMDGGTYTSSNAPKKGTYTQGAKNGISFIDMKDVPFSGTYTDADGNEQDADAMWDKFLDQLSTDELCDNMPDSAAAVSSVNSPKAAHGDGPDGVEGTLEIGQNTTCYNSEIVSSSTFNPKMLQLRGSFEAEDALYAKQTVVWGPGANLHRTPFGGRSYEYYSEDGYMSYYCSYYQVTAMNAKGLIACVKHFAGNDQETNRYGVATFNTEQAWRTNMMKSFEGAIAKGHSLGVMTSYNCLGCTPSPSCSASNIDIMQTEWGFTNMNITDCSYQMDFMDTTDCIMNGTSNFCLDNGRANDCKKLVSRRSDDDIIAGLRQANKQFYFALLKSNATNGIAAGATAIISSSWWETGLIAIISVVAVLTALCLAWYAVNAVFGIIGNKKNEGGEE